MVRFKQKIDGNKHSIVRSFIPFLSFLDDFFGENCVTPGRFRKISSVGSNLCLDVKGYDDSRKGYILQAKQNGEMQYFYIRGVPEDIQRIMGFVAEFDSSRSLMQGNRTYAESI